MILTGLVRLGRDAEVRYLPDGTAVANLSLAYNYGKKDSENKRPSQWINATIWGERAEKLSPYLLKGIALVVVLEDVHIEEFERRDGGTGSSLKARIASLEFAGGKKDDGQQQASTTGSGSNPYRDAKEGKGGASGGGKKGGGAIDQMDDDIPF